LFTFIIKKIPLSRHLKKWRESGIFKKEILLKMAWKIMIYFPLSCNGGKVEKMKKKVAWRESSVTQIKGYIWPIIKLGGLNFCVITVRHCTNILLKIHIFTYSIFVKLTNHQFMPPNIYPLSEAFENFFLFYSNFI
jgi:hypothetical protein